MRSFAKTGSSVSCRPPAKSLHFCVFTQFLELFMARILATG